MTIAVYLLLLAIAVGWLSNLIRVPYAILLVMAGIAVGFLPQARMIFAQPELLLAVVLPAALYPAAIDTSWRDFRRNLRPIWGHRGSMPEARLNTRTVWYTVLFLANCFVFAYMGLALPQTLSSLSSNAAALSWPDLIRLGLLLSLIVIAIRFVWVFPATYLPRLLSRKVRAREPLPPVRGVMVVSFCGMRGVVSLAIALALPQTLPDGSPFAERGLIIFLTLCVILVTLVGQGLAFPAFLRMLNIQPDHDGEDEEPLARERMRHAALRKLDRLVEEHDAPAYVAVGIKRALAAEVTHTHDADGRADHLSMEATLWINVIDAQRAELLKLWEAEQIGDEVLRHLERELDLVAARVVHQQR